MSNPTTCVDCGEPTQSAQSPRCPPCRKAHMLERCRENMRRSRAENPDKHRERARLFYADHPQKYREWGRRWRAANLEQARKLAREALRRRWASYPESMREQKREQKRLRRAANPEKYRAADNRYSRKRYAENPEPFKAHCKAWNAANPEAKRAQSQNRKARKRAAFVAPVTATDIARMTEQQAGRCAAPWCDASLADGYHVDHIIPLAKGGTHEPGNVQLLCPGCNLSKGCEDARYVRA